MAVPMLFHARCRPMCASLHQLKRAGSQAGLQWASRHSPNNPQFQPPRSAAATHRSSSMNPRCHLDWRFEHSRSSPRQTASQQSNDWPRCSPCGRLPSFISPRTALSYLWHLPLSGAARCGARDDRCRPTDNDAAATERDFGDGRDDKLDLFTSDSLPPASLHKEGSRPPSSPHFEPSPSSTFHPHSTQPLHIHNGHLRAAPLRRRHRRPSPGRRRLQR